MMASEPAILAAGRRDGRRLDGLAGQRVLVDPLGETVERPTQKSRNLHLRDAQVARDLHLRHLLTEAQHEHRSFPVRKRSKDRREGMNVLNQPVLSILAAELFDPSS